MKKTKIFVNMRFLTQRITGVQRFAYEIMLSIDRIINDSRDFEFIGLMPNQDINLLQYESQFKNIKIQKCGILKSHLWEQIELPIYSRGVLLLNLCNMAPIIKLKQFITLHDIISFTNIDSQKWWFKTWYKFVIKLTSKSALLVFTVSNFSKAEIYKYLSPIDVKVLGNASVLSKYSCDDSILPKLKINK